MFTYKLTNPDSGTEKHVTADSRDVVIWERSNKGGRSLADIAAKRGTMTDHYGIAHAAIRRQDRVEEFGKQSDFEAHYLLELVKADEEDPTNPAA